MDETFNQNELSAEDLATLRAFDALDMRDWEAAIPSTEIPAFKTTHPLAGQDMSAQPALTGMLSPQEMLSLFIGEADENMTTIRQTLQQLEPDDQLDIAHLQALQRTVHKMKGTSGAVGCTVLATIAQRMEELLKLIISGAVVPFIGLNALVQTVHALELTLNSFVTYGQESSIPLVELEEEYRALNIPIQVGSLPENAPPTNVEEHTAFRLPFRAQEDSSSEKKTRPLQEHSSSTSFVRVDLERLEQLVLHSEKLAELRAPLENAQAEVEKALQELHTAQTRLRYLQTLLTTPFALKMSNSVSGQAENDERPTSSLVARILDEASQRTGHSYQRKFKLPSYKAGFLRVEEGLPWDELEIDRFTESDVLLHSFSEAIADVDTASSQLRIAFAQLSHITQRHMVQVANVRTDTLLLRLAPMSALLPSIEHAITKSTIAQRRRVQFQVEGETTEINQDIMEDLKHPLLQLIRSCIADSLLATPDPGEQREDAYRIWLHMQAIGNEVTIELGFSMPVNGGALEEVHEAIRRLNGSISAQFNAAGGISFYLRLPRSQGSVRGLLVRAGSQRVGVPFSQVLYIDNGRKNLAEAPADLNTLLGFAGTQTTLTTVRPVLVLKHGSTPLAVEVDEVLGEVELVVKPLAPHLQRPGIAETAIDGMGNVLLMVDLPQLVSYWEKRQSGVKLEARPGDRQHYSGHAQPSILIADDSVYIRQSLLQTLSRAGYYVMEAHDGIRALELLLARPPHVLVLDIEMPNLNGYDLLSIMRVYPELAQVKIVMLTARSSEKHQRRAHEMGAHAYLTKPCPPETLLEMIKSLLTSS